MYKIMGAEVADLGVRKLAGLVALRPGVTPTLGTVPVGTQGESRELLKAEP